MGYNALPGGRLTVCHDESRVSDRSLRLGILVGVAVYVALFLVGLRTFVLKTAILPAFAAYALVLPSVRPFLVDWIPLLLATIAFDFLRGAIYVAVEAGFRPIYAAYAIALEHLTIRTDALPLVLQRFRTPVLDWTGVALHGSHFLFFLGFGLALWHASRTHFPLYRRSLIIAMVVGLVGYLLIPTVPPWMAALPPYELLPPIERIVGDIYERFLPELYGTFDTNPVAAMPSLHAAFPSVAALIGWRALGRPAGIVLWVYAAAAMLAAAYLGEHYLVDVIAGLIVAVIAVRLAARNPSL